MALVRIAANTASTIIHTVHLSSGYHNRCSSSDVPAIVRIETRTTQAGTTTDQSARTPQRIASVKRGIQKNPSVSTMKNNAPVSKTTFSRITRKDLNFHPYRVHTVTEHEQEATCACIVHQKL